MTTTLSLAAPAKINLYLEICGDRADGYHELTMVLQSIDLCDRVELRRLPLGDIVLRCDRPDLPADRTNLAYRAALLLQERYPDRGGVEIVLYKHIPVGAGLAGGSADGAAVLVGLDRLWQLGLTLPELQALAANLGSDGPFCLGGGTALATGRGEVLSPLADIDGMPLVVCKPRDLAIATAWAYQTFRAQRLLASSPVRHGERSAQLLQAIASHAPDRAAQIGALLYNDLERVVLPAHPEVARLKAALQAQGALGALMSGSGSAVFAIAPNCERAAQMAEAIAAAIPGVDAWATTTTIGGIREV